MTNEDREELIAFVLRRQQLDRYRKKLSQEELEAMPDERLQAAADEFKASSRAKKTAAAEAERVRERQRPPDPARGEHRRRRGR